MNVISHRIIWEKKVDRYFMGRRVQITLQKVQAADGTYHMVEMYDSDISTCPAMTDPAPIDRYQPWLDR